MHAGSQAGNPFRSPAVSQGLTGETLDCLAARVRGWLDDAGYSSGSRAVGTQAPG